MTELQQLTDRLVRAYATVPAPVLDSARLHFIDAVGVALAASKTGPAPGVVALAKHTSGPGTVLGTPGGSSAAIAALVNGTLMHSVEYDDTHTASVVHGSSVVASTALAVAEEVSAAGDELLRAFAVGWEFFIRLGLASPGGLQARGFQVTSAAGPFAAAVVAGLLRGSGPDVIANAIGIAGSQAGGTFAFLAGGDTVKAAQVGWAAHAGILADELARAGVTGPDSVFAGRYGFYRLYADDAQAESELFAHCAEIGERWRLLDTAFKLLPCCHYIHPFVEALEDLVEEAGGSERIASVHCEVPSEVVPIIAEPWAERQRPARAQDARWSLPYVLAWVLERGRVGFVTFVGEAAEEVVRVAQRVTFEPWEGSGFPARFPARVRVLTSDGDEFSREVSDVFGSAGRPISAERVKAKARENFASGGLDAASMDAVDRLLLGAESTVAQVSSLLRGERATPEGGSGS